MPSKKQPGTRKPKAKSSPEPGQTIPVYVGYPQEFTVPVEDLPQQPNTYHVSRELKFYALNHSTRKFEETHDPIDAIEALTHAHRTEVYPPISVLTWLAERLNQYIDQCGKEVSLDKILGLPPGRGRHGNIFKQKDRENQDFMMCRDVIFWKAFRGREGLRVDDSTIFKIVAKYHGRKPSSLKRSYDSGAWGPYRQSAKSLAADVIARPNFDWKAFVSKFPYHILDELSNEIDLPTLALHRDHPRH